MWITPTASTLQTATLSQLMHTPLPLPKTCSVTSQNTHFTRLTPYAPFTMLHFFLDISIQKPLEFQLVRPLSSLVKHILMESYKSNLPVLARKNQLPIHWMLLVLNLTLNTKLFPSPQKRFHLRRLFLQSLTWRFFTLVHLTLPCTCHNIKRGLESEESRIPRYLTLFTKGFSFCSFPHLFIT